ncbi:MAG: LPS ABC transporter substrate-binding protein LptA, partial [Bradyrhizobium sp.]
MIAMANFFLRSEDKLGVALSMAALAIGFLLIAAGTAHAQSSASVPNAMQGFSQNRDQPIQIDAASLEMR